MTVPSAFARKPGADTRLSFEEIDLAMIDEASVFHFGTLSLTDDPVRTATKKCVEYAKRQGKLITFDPNLRLPLWETTDAAKEQILWGLAHADVVKISDEEVEFLWGITDEKEAAKKLLDEFGIRLAMITMGPKGAYLANQNGAAYAKCPEVKPIDTTGAGDIFGGSAVSRLLKTGKKPEELGMEELALSAVCLHGGESFDNTVGRDSEYSGGRGGPGPDVKKDKFGFLWKFCCTHLRNPDIIQMSGQQVQAGRLQ
ncbi:MAG: PfkB family carbohydrate kinase [Lachnospiraceae bacterium]